MNFLGSTAALTSCTGLTMARAVGSAAAFFAQLLLARFMEPSELGIFYVVTSMAIVLGTVAAIGYPGIANRLIVRYAARRQHGKAAAFIRTARRDTLCIALGVITAVIAGAGTGFAGGPDHVWPAIIAAFAIPAFAFLRINGGFANAVQRFALSFLPDNLIRPVLFSLVLGALAVSTGSLGLVPVVCVFSALTITIAVSQTWAIGWRGDGSGPVPATDRRQTRLWRRSGLSLVVPLLITALFADLAIMASGPLLEPPQIALFGLCIKIAFLTGFFVHAAHQIATPKFAEALQSRRPEDLSSVIANTNAMACGVMTGAVAAVWLLGDALLGIFGPQFRTGASILTILAGAQLVRALGGPSLSLLIASGKHASGVSAMIASLAVFGVTLVILTPSMGVTGVSIAVLTATVVSSAGLAAVVRSELGVSCDVLSQLRLWLPAARPIGRPIS